jgi:hypothetical protein
MALSSASDMSPTSLIGSGVVDLPYEMLKAHVQTNMDLPGGSKLGFFCSGATLSHY